MESQPSFSAANSLVQFSQPKVSKPWPKVADKMDNWLDSLGYYRKHIAKDASSLFRCIAENVYLTQVYHTRVREECMDFVSKHVDVFQKLSANSVDEYADRLNNPREPGTMLDLQIMSLVYKCDFILYTEIGAPSKQVTFNNFRRKMLLSFTDGDHFDTVYTKKEIDCMALCQSIVYEILYKEVFQLEGVDYAVYKMLHDKTSRYQKEMTAAFFSSGFEIKLQMRDRCKNVKELIDIGITPFPYKVAKSLDPTVYRNVEFDTWNDQRKGSRGSLSLWNSMELQVGSKCYVKMEGSGKEVVKRSAYVQEMSPNKGPVVVFDEKLGKRITVPYEALELIPIPVPQLASTQQNFLEKLKLIHSRRMSSVRLEEAKANGTLADSNSVQSIARNSDIRQITEEECQSPVVSSSTNAIDDERRSENVESSYSEEGSQNVQSIQPEDNMTAIQAQNAENTMQELPSTNTHYHLHHHPNCQYHFSRQQNSSVAFSVDNGGSSRHTCHYLHHHHHPHQHIEHFRAAGDMIQNPVQAYPQFASVGDMTSSPTVLSDYPFTNTYSERIVTQHEQQQRIYPMQNPTPGAGQLIPIVPSPVPVQVPPSPTLPHSTNTLIPIVAPFYPILPNSPLVTTHQSYHQPVSVYYPQVIGIDSHFTHGHCYSNYHRYQDPSMRQYSAPAAVVVPSPQYQNHHHHHTHDLISPNGHMFAPQAMIPAHTVN